jgi:MFS transporter, CP family, cyanate transporter
MTSPASALFGRGRILALVGILLVAFNLRTAVGAISPIIDLIDAEVSVDHLVLSIIGAAPPLIFAASGLIGPVLARFAGLERGMLVIVALLVGGHVLRAVAPDAVALTAGTVIALLGAGVGNVLLPPLVKKYFPDRIGTVTAIYVTIMSIGATIPPVFAVPIAESAGWRASLGVWAVTAAIAVLPWIAELVASRRRIPTETADLRVAAIAAEPALAGRMVRSRIAWATALMFGATSIGAYAAFAWLPELLVDTAGVDAATAGVLLGLFAFCGFPSALLVPVLATRLRSVIPLVAAGILLLLGGYLGLLLVPAAAPWLWVFLYGMGPLLFPLGLTLINLRSRTQAGSVALSGFMQGVGYAIGAAGPLVVGLLRDATGGWTAPLAFLLVSLVLALPALVVLRTPRFVEDELDSSARAAR